MCESPLVLDLDLDFFLDGIEHNPSRQRPQWLHPWTESEFVDFLERRCYLSTSSLIAGRVVARHYDAFYYWRELVRGGNLSKPFRVFHVDAHADLGFDIFNGFHVLKYLSQSVLAKPVAKRDTPLRGRKRLWETNYLLFAVACHWLEDITFVTHPDWRGNDFHKFFFRNSETNAGFVELVRFDPAVFNSWSSFDFDTSRRVHVEPAVPLEAIPGTAFHSPGPYNFASLSVSPGYTPFEAEALINVFRRYIKES